MSETITRTDLVGTLDELEPELRSRGFVAVRTMAGPIDLAQFDPYGMRRLGSVNLRSERWADHVFRGCLAYSGDQAYIAGAKVPEPGSAFIGGLFPLMTAADLRAHTSETERRERMYAADDRAIDDQNERYGHGTYGDQS